MESYFLKIFVFTFGAIIGSFLNALIYRIPREINIAVPRSSCPNCKKLIYWYENIPILSFIILRGKCSGCSNKISVRYPLIELTVGLFSLISFPANLDLHYLILFLVQISVFSAFVVHFFIDLDFQILPDSINAYLAIIFLIWGLVDKGLAYSISGGLIGFIFPYLVSYAFLKIRNVEGLGGGDIKLWGALGLYLGPVGIAYNIFLSCFLGSIVAISLILLKKMSKDTPLPFGPFILIVAVIQIFFSKILLPIVTYIS